MDQKDVNEFKIPLSFRFFKPLKWFLIGTTLGAGIIFFYDPVQGNRRRALIRDKGVRLRHDLADFGVKFLKNAGNRSKGAILEFIRSAKPTKSVDDVTLENRVRSYFGRIVSHPKAIRSDVHNQVVTLSGSILAREVDSLITSVNTVPGVKKVINQLEVHETSDGISSLQGTGTH